MKKLGQLCADVIEALAREGIRETSCLHPPPRKTPRSYVVEIWRNPPLILRWNDCLHKGALELGGSGAGESDSGWPRPWR
jgi:hypothetical protein